MSITTRTPLTLYDTPDEAAAAIAAIVSALGSAKTRVRAMLYAMTHPQLVEALIGAHTRGVDVKVIVDHSQAVSSSGTPAVARLRAGIGSANVRLGTAPTGMIQHRKSCSIDSRIYITGSLNWSLSAPREENDLLVCTSRPLATHFEGQFDALWTWIQAHESALQPAS